MTNGSFDTNSQYFLWILLGISIVLLVILGYHCRRGGKCDFRSKKDDNEIQTCLTSELV